MNRKIIVVGLILAMNLLIINFGLFDRIMTKEPLVKSEQNNQQLIKSKINGYTDEGAFALIQTIDGGFALAGYTTSFGAGGRDMWLMKTDANGVTQWNRTYGGTETDEANALLQTADGGFALAGYTTSFGAGGRDMWLVKTDVNGITQWDQSYGGTSTDVANALLQTTNGSFVLAGYTTSYGVGGMDMWLVKTDANGVTQWNRTYGGTRTDVAYALLQTTNGSFVQAGYTRSFGAGGEDMWLVKVDESGVLQWNKSYGGRSNERANSLLQSTNDSFVLAGWTSSFDVGGGDMWLVKTDASGTLQWEHSYGGNEFEIAYTLLQTTDGDFALAGFTESYGTGERDMWLVQTDSNGLMQWDQTYGGEWDDQIASLIQLADGSFVLAGYTRTYQPGGGYDNDLWLIKTDNDGFMQWEKKYGEKSFEITAFENLNAGVFILTAGFVLTFIVIILKSTKPTPSRIYRPGTYEFPRSIEPDPDEYCFAPKGLEKYHSVKLALSIVLLAILLLFSPIAFGLKVVIFFFLLVIDYFYSRMISWPFIMVGYLILRQFKSRFLSPKPVYINPHKRQVRQGNDVLFENIPENARVIIDKKFSSDIYVSGIADNLKYPSKHYSINWELGINYGSDSQTDVTPLFNHSESLGRLFDSFKPQITDCHWIDELAEKIAELMEIPVVDVTNGQSNVINPEHLQAPLANILREGNYVKPFEDEVHPIKEIKEYQNKLNMGSRIKIKEKSTGIEIKTNSKWMIPRGMIETPANNFGPFFRIVGGIFSLFFCYFLLIDPLVVSIGEFLLALQFLYNSPTEYFLNFILTIGFIILIVTLINRLKPRVKILITPSKIIVRDSFFPFYKKVILIDNLKRLRVINVWEKKSLEFTTSDGRIILPGDYESANDIQDLIQYIISRQKP